MSCWTWFSIYRIFANSSILALCHFLWHKSFFFCSFFFLFLARKKKEKRTKKKEITRIFRGCKRFFSTKFCHKSRNFAPQNLTTSMLNFGQPSAAFMRQSLMIELKQSALNEFKNVITCTAIIRTDNLHYVTYKKPVKFLTL